VARIELDHLTKRYGETAAVDGLTLEVRDHEFLTLLGPSGCGKTTTLRMIAGFVRPDGGRILVDNELLSSPDGVVPPERRRMGMVFQNYAVWPHKTVFQNVAFGLEVQRRPRGETAERVEQILALVGLEGLGGRYPNQLSGGQQQRVALARSLVVEPSILLLDEPLSNLDAKLRERMRWELKQIQRRTGITFVYVTHDQAEAMALSDRVAVMHLGRLQQVDAPRVIYRAPANRMVADFMGQVNLVTARLLRPTSPDSLAEAALGALRIPLASAPGVRSGEELLVALRPESLRLSPPPVAANGEPRNADLPIGTVAEAVFLGSVNDYEVDLAGSRLRVQAPAADEYEVGERVLVSVADRATALES
jgi:iron(III) transport system ATP-binding protein